MQLSSSSDSRFYLSSLSFFQFQSPNSPQRGDSNEQEEEGNDDETLTLISFVTHADPLIRWFFF